MQKSEPSHRVRQVAAVALLNSIEFCNENFSRDNDRNAIMQVREIIDALTAVFYSLLSQVVCEATQSEDAKVAVPALQSLVKIVSLYYHYMEQYMGTALFGVSLFRLHSGQCL
jgi:importin subunit beta-1